MNPSITSGVENGVFYIILQDQDGVRSEVRCGNKGPDGLWPVPEMLRELTDWLEYHRGETPNG